MRYICKLSSEAHERVLREIKAGHKEYQIEALFGFHTFSNSGSRFQAYNCICASGRDAATLHYIVNDKLLKEDSLILSDMGAKYKGYCVSYLVFLVEIIDRSSVFCYFFETTRIDQGLYKGKPNNFETQLSTIIYKRSL